MRQAAWHIFLLTWRASFEGGRSNHYVGGSSISFAVSDWRGRPPATSYGTSITSIDCRDHPRQIRLLHSGGERHRAAGDPSALGRVGLYTSHARCYYRCRRHGVRFRLDSVSGLCLTIGSSDRAGIFSVEPRRESMIQINQLRLSAAQPCVAQPHR
jgi:hypothetical protein